MIRFSAWKSTACSFCFIFLSLLVTALPNAGAIQPHKRGGQVPSTAGSWAFGGLGGALGFSGMYAEDMTGDGNQELVISSGTFWNILSVDGFGLRHNFISEVQYFDINRNIRQVVSFSQVTGSPTVAVGFEDGTIDLFQPPCREPLETIDLSQDITDVARLILANVDLDSDLELVISDGIDLFIFSASAPYTLEKTIPGLGGFALAVGQVDTDPELEIVTQKNDRGYVVDAKGQIEWDFASGFGDFIDLGDIDQDGKEEIVAATSFDFGGGPSFVSVFDADIKSLKWDEELESFADTLRVGDINGDAIPEILYSDRTPSLVTCRDGGGNLLWSVADDYPGVPEIAFMDVDRNGVNELLYGVGTASLGPQFLNLLDTTTQTIRWRSDSLGTGYFNVAIGDLDQNQTEEIIMCSPSSESGQETAILHVFHGKTRELLYRGFVGEAGDTRIVNAIKIANVDQDPQNEIILISEVSLLVIDGLSFTVEFKLVDYSLKLSSLDLADVDLDGALEIVVGNNRPNQRAVSVFDGASGQLEWQSPLFTTGELYSVRVRDVDLDGNPDIVSATTSAIDFFDGVTKQFKHRIPFGPTTAMTLANIDDDAAVEIICGNGDGEVIAYDGQTYVEQLRQQVQPGKRIISLQYQNLRGSAQPEWILGLGREVFVYQDIFQAPVWQNGFRGYNWGTGNQMAIGHFVDDGLGELFIGSLHALVEFAPRAMCDPRTTQEMQADWPLPALDIRDLMAAQFCFETCP